MLHTSKEVKKITTHKHIKDDFPYYCPYCEKTITCKRTEIVGNRRTK
jgi:hypothetical protein